jgi:hypothetical protein
VRIAIELPIDLRQVPSALAEIRREGAQRRQVYPRWIEAGKLAAPTAQRRLLALADAYRVVEAVATAVAPLLEERSQDLFAQGARDETTGEERMQ